jgi:uncharacterized protein YdcH (DUF465 family)
MTDPIRRIVERFPDFRERIKALNEPGSNFNALCHEYGQVADRLGRTEASREADSEQQADRLRRRRDALEQQLLAMMQQTQRV